MWIIREWQRISPEAKGFNFFCISNAKDRGDDDDEGTDCEDSDTDW